MHTNNGKTPEKALNPSQLNRLAKNSLENSIGSIWITGEVTNASANQNLHIYFALKDASASVSCAFFKNANFGNIRLKNGDSLLVYGQVSLFEKTGNYQIIVKRVERSGTGDRAKAFAKLKVQLEAMGYFSQEKKKPLPKIINSLAIVTSQTSAAITDVLNVIKRRNPLLDVIIYHASVQGDNAVEEIIDALLSADINKHDVILLTRGGGSVDDLWTFNDVSIAQTLFNLETPCVSAIGHERDTVISDLVADTYAITPTAAAEMLTPDISELKIKLKHNLQSLYHIIITKINNKSQLLDNSFHQLEKSHPQTKIQLEKQKLKSSSAKLQQLTIQSLQSKSSQLSLVNNYFKHYDFNLNEQNSKLEYLKNNLIQAVEQSLTHNKSQLENLIHSLNTLSPLSTLSRGYSITLKQNTNNIISQENQIETGDIIETKLKQGRILSKVIS
jgi:exodeoxyribonuclease VII large subunit